MSFADLVVYTCLVVYVLYITRIYNMWGVSKGTSKARIDVRKEKVFHKRRLRALSFLSKCEWFALNVGFPPSEATLQEWGYRIGRLQWTMKYIEREIKPLEFIGLLRMISFFSVVLGALGLILTGSPIYVAFFLTLFLRYFLGIYADMKIADEDKELERDFPDLYLLLYSRLVQRNHTRLAPVLQDFLHSLDAVPGGAKDSAIRKFATDLRNNIEIYGDDSLAISKLRDKYRSVMIINFCNLAVQALRGVDNSDKLLSFKVELSQQRLAQMEERANKLVRQGSRAVLVVYVILFQFIFLSWLAKFQLVGDFWKVLGF